MADVEQHRGRPRESRVDHAIVTATRELLAEGGYAALTTDAVAHRAGIGKAAIYRRYATKQEMVFVAAVHDLELEPLPDTGSLLGDLTALTEEIVRSLTGPAIFASAPALFADVASDPELANRFQQTFIEAEQANLRLILDRARQRGDLADTPDLADRPDPEVLHALVLGPIFIWLFMFRAEPSAIAAQVATATHQYLTTS